MSLSMTDAIYLAILTVLLFFLLWSLKSKMTRDIWAGILAKPVALSSLMVIVFFVAISVLDSIRLVESSQEVESSTLLDKLLSPLGDVHEQTYSAPLSLTLYNKELQLTPEGVVQSYPRLTYPPEGLKTPHDVHELIALVLFNSLGMALSITLLAAISCGVLRCLSHHVGEKRGEAPDAECPVPQKARGKRGAWLQTFFAPKYQSAFITFLVTVFILMFIALTLYGLSRSLHVFGTGKVGEDILYYSIKSIRTGLVIGVVTTLVTLPFAIGLGVMAGYFGGVVDDAIQYLYTTLSSVPGVLLITASVLAFETYITNHPDWFGDLAMIADARLLALCLILGLTSWTGLCRLVRAETMKLREMDYVLAAKVLGSRKRFILWHHMIPNLMHLVILTLVLDFSQLVLAEAVLSYIGVGVSPMTMSWGNMINAARLELAREPLVYWPVICAFVMMFTLVLACNLFAEVMRRAYDPREQG